MASYKVIRRFRDIKDKRVYNAGDKFPQTKKYEVTEDRYKFLEDAGFIKIEKEAKAAPKPKPKSKKK